MQTQRVRLLLSSSLLLALALPAQSALAADTQDAASAPDDIIVTGTRAQGRSKLESSSPVDVLSADSLRRQGSPELATALAAVAPSIDFPRPSATDGTDAIRPATLRGMSPDQTLVLINGVRAHTSALLNVNGSVGRGSSAVDLNTIPSAALESIEVLRDGASAQYGSDAIAGVVNLRLREANHGGGATASYGFYDTDVNAARSSRHVTGEPTVSASAWQGMKLGGDGFLTATFDYQHRSATNRSDVDPRITPKAVDGRFGDPEAHQYSTFVNFGKPINDVWSLYGWVGYQYRNSTSAAFPRLTSAYSAYGITSIYPSGFLPYINSHSKDLNTALGIKGEVGGWQVDANISYGWNKLRFWTRNSANYTYGATTQTNFYDGSVSYDQLVGGVDVSKKFDIFQSLNVAWGVEARRESYHIGAGEYASYAQGTVFPNATYGAQGFTGFSPANVVNAHRSNVSGYVDVEAQLTDKFRLGLAGRGEGYSDFGATGTGKVSMRYDFSKAFALRATGSTGFRAPSLAQQYYTSITSVVSNGNVLLTGTYPSISAIASSLGGKALEPERAASISAGAVIRVGGLDLTIDGYYTHVRNQLALSENLTASMLTSDGAALLSAAGIQAARFFINGVGSTTKGIDAVAHYRLNDTGAGTFDFTLAGNVNKISITNVPTLTTTLNPSSLFLRSRQLTITEGTPGEKITGTLDWSRKQIGATARVSYYGNVTVPGTTAASDYSTGRHVVTDLELRYQPKDQPLNLAIGANNLFDVYPDKTPASLNSTGVVAFPGYSPFGYNGRYIYVRAGIKW